MYISGEGLTSVLKELGDDLTGAEIGVCRGENMKYWLEKCPNIKRLIGVDPWEAYEEMSQDDLNWYYKTALDNLNPFLKSGRAGIYRQKSAVLGVELPNEFFNFVFIDGNHTYPFVLEDLMVWYPKIKPGGLVTGHDWGKKGVVDAVSKFRDDMGIGTPIVRVSNSAWYFYKPGGIYGTEEEAKEKN